jgi:TolB-like protein
MKQNTLAAIVVLLGIALPGLPGFCAGEAEAADSSARGEYLASRGIIIPPKDIYPESYIAQIDYDYPDPSPDPVGLTVHTGNRQIGSGSRKEWIHIGIKGRKTPFEQLPPLNLVFVIDKSGSMYEADKLNWVKEGLDIFLSKVREKDYVALVVYDEDARVVFPSTRMDRERKKTQFKEAVQGVTTGGGTNLLAGMTAGYQQALANFREDHTNRVLLLTDGLSDSAGAMKMAESYKNTGINCSTIGVGVSFNTALMVELAKAGGGSSRFISDKEEMEKIFFSELDRMVVAAGRDLSIELRLLNGAALLDTWGYRHQRLEGLVRYSLPTLHNGDYETILAEVALPGRKPAGVFTFAEVRVSYKTLEGRMESLPPVRVSTRVVGAEAPVYSVSDPTVLRSSTMLETARSLTRIGTLYYASQPDAAAVSEKAAADSPVSPELKEALALAQETKKRVQNARQVLDETGFDDEIKIFESYIDILGAANRLEGVRVAEMKEAREIAPQVRKRPLTEHMRYMFDEVVLSLPLQQETSIAVAGFSYPNNRRAPILDLLNEYALVSMTGVDKLKVIERRILNAILEEQELQLSGLMDTAQAIKVGRLSAAQWILTGTVIDMPESLVVFIRVIDVQSGEILSVSQVLLAKEPEILQLL